MQWGPTGAPQPLSSVLGIDPHNGRDPALRGGDSYLKGSMNDGERMGDDDTSEEGYESRQLWSGQGYDSEDEVNPVCCSEKTLSATSRTPTHLEWWLASTTNLFLNIHGLAHSG